MNQPAQHRSAYERYPFLTPEEFAEACHYLDRKYCQATLGALRKEWRLHVHNALDSSYGHHDGLITFLQITRSLEDRAVDHDLAAQLGSINLAGPTTTADQMMVELEESDKEVLPISSRTRASRASFQARHVVYEIHLHPTYQAPCLWFSLHNLPFGQSAMDIETVFRWLVPNQFENALRGQGPIGGISIDHHPVTGVPTFFVHPCLLGDAMTGFDCSKEDYLMVWLGLVGGCVGLWVPKEMAMTIGA
ncbi:Uu.00g014680.m01.CDS01 [Anthostomella pinea]|uniref:Ubiquitin-like-conjugating enzyme ATG10 n=1 Tax=Anthostomella pinea TaxID=933095 RepID=A0AAI8VZ17_9PEZI|nr:Uu.00g014680.m01.CDS01 [Anthostomella pinea]